VSRIFPLPVQVGEERGQVEEIDLAGADQLEGDRDVLIPSEPDIAALHSRHHPVEPPAVGDTPELELGAVPHGPIFALTLPAGKSSPSTETSDPDRVRQLRVPGRVALRGLAGAGGKPPNVAAGLSPTPLGRRQR
jgi:hypothetical protein